MSTEKKSLNRIIIAASLVGVYCMYLLFFQAFLTNPHNQTTRYLKKSFSHKVTLTKRNTLAAVDYAQLGQDGNNIHPVNDLINDCLQYKFSLTIVSLHKAFIQPVAQNHHPDDAYRLYLQQRAFLI